MRLLRLLALIAALLLLTWQRSSHALELLLPIEGEPERQWIVVVDKMGMQIVPAKASKEDGGILISATVQAQATRLESAVLFLKDGRMVSMPLSAVESGSVPAPNKPTLKQKPVVSER